jgi:hypothetical protein
MPPIAPALTAPQVQLLRSIIKDANFRKQFLEDPVGAAAASKTRISANELSTIARLNATQFEAIHTVAAGIAKRADGTDTALHALAYAVVIALLLAMPNPMDIGEQISER